MPTVNNSLKVCFLIALLALPLGVCAQGAASTAPAAAPATEVSDTEIVDDWDETDGAASAGAQVEQLDNSDVISEEPVIDTTSSVLNKKVSFAKSFSVDLENGTLPDEMIVNSRYNLVRISNYMNEDFSYGVGYRGRYGGQTEYSQNFLSSPTPLDFSRAPEPTKAGFITFGYNFFYGKLSLLKNSVIPTLTKVNTDFGLQAYGTMNRPFLQISLNQLFFVTKNMALGFNFGFGFADIIDPTSVDVNVAQPAPAESRFSGKMQFSKTLGLNLNLFL